MDEFSELEKNSKLFALSPIDGRYADKLTELRPIFSEFGLINYRLIVEIEWFKFIAAHANISKLPAFSAAAMQHLDNICKNFSAADALRIKKIEATTNHDVKAVEYFIKEKIANHDELTAVNEFIHFGCTSEDVNNLAYSLMLSNAREKILLPQIDKLISQLKIMAREYAAIAMLARTHGQPATPTTVGKEFANVAARLMRQRAQLADATILGKLNGASGNYNALHTAHSSIDWQALSEKFIRQLNLAWNPYTTQIEPHDALAEFFAILSRINIIILDLNRDVWSYIAINYFKLSSVASEVGSSTMPHKVNPIDFENSEGNVGIANALFGHMANKLGVSRWQRDLSDSTVLRNMGAAIGHSILAYQATLKGLKKIAPHHEHLAADLNAHWEVLAEAIQTVMRKYNLPQPYEQLKTFTRGKIMTKELLHSFIADLTLPAEVKKELLALKPESYIGYAETLAKRI